MLHLLYSLPSFEDSAQNRNRTSDTRIFSPLLYQLSYLGILDLNLHSDLSSGDRIWTYDLRVMSPTSFQTAPPRDIMLYMICSLLRKYSRKRKWMEVDSNHRSNLQQIYSLSPLATRESIHVRQSALTMWNCSICSHKLQDIFYYFSVKVQP